MENKLTINEFTMINNNSIEQTYQHLNKIVFNKCINNFDGVYLSKDEYDCINKVTEKYIETNQLVVNSFKRKLII